MLTVKQRALCTIVSLAMMLTAGRLHTQQAVTPQVVRPTSEPGDASTVALEELERQTILRTFEKVGGDKAKAGELLGISRATLYRKLKRYQIAASPRDEKIEV